RDRGRGRNPRSMSDTTLPGGPVAWTDLVPSRAASDKLQQALIVRSSRHPHSLGSPSLVTHPGTASLPRRILSRRGHLEGGMKGTTGTTSSRPGTIAVVSRKDCTRSEQLSCIGRGISWVGPAGWSRSHRAPHREIPHGARYPALAGLAIAPLLLRLGVYPAR